MRYLLFCCLPLMLFCHPQSEAPVIPQLPAGNPFAILALGDSYTKGQSVPWKQNFPNQLYDSLKAEFPGLASPKIIAQTGWRTDDLQDAIAAAADEIGKDTFQLVTLCIGVNNQYQHADFDSYKTEFESLLQYALARAGGRKERVMVISIPDWAYTPYGQQFSTHPEYISADIDRYNAANLAIAMAYGVQYQNITPISRNGLEQPELVAPDGLHPSAQQYAAWVHQILPGARMAFKH